MGSPHNGWHTLLSFDDSIDDFDRIRRGASSTRPASTPASCPPARAISSSAATSPATCPTRSAHGNGGARTTRLSWISGLDPQGRHHRGSRQEDQGVRPLMDVDALKATFDEYQAFLRGKEGRGFHRSQKTSRRSWTTARTTPSPCTRLLLHLGRPDEERARPRCWIPPRTPSRVLYAAGCFGNFQSHSYRHHRRQQRREPGVGPHFRPSRRGSRALGRQDHPPSLIGSALALPSGAGCDSTPAPAAPVWRIWRETAFRTAIRLIGEAHDRASTHRRPAPRRARRPRRRPRAHGRDATLSRAARRRRSPRLRRRPSRRTGTAALRPWTASR